MAKDFSEDQKVKILNKTFGTNKTITDPFGRRVSKSKAEIDHIYPKSKGGKATLNNAQVLHPKSNLYFVQT